MQMLIWNAFASAWDDIIDDLRQSDIVSDKEVRCCTSNPPRS